MLGRTNALAGPSRLGGLALNVSRSAPRASPSGLHACGLTAARPGLRPRIRQTETSRHPRFISTAASGASGSATAATDHQADDPYGSLLLSSDGLPGAIESPPFEPSILDPLAQALISLPLSSGVTIILLTLILRSCFTLPVTLWQRRRLIRNATEVMPRMQEINNRLAGVVAKECRKKGMSYEAYQKELKRQLAVEQAALHRQFKTHPTITLAAPLAVHIPLLIATSLTLRRALELPGSEMASEGFLWLSNLGEVDGSGILPILGALLGMGNAELVGRKGKAAEDRATAAAQEAGALSASAAGVTEAVVPPQSSGPAGRPIHARRFSTTSSKLAAPPKTRRPVQLPPQPVSPRLPAAGSAADSRLRTTPQAHLTSLNPKGQTRADAERQSLLRNRVITNIMRISAVMFVPIASTVPSALALYWTSSMAFTFCQSLYLNSLDRTRKALAASAKATMVR